jgi:cytochrome c-type biogenesis protein CcmE
MELTPRTGPTAAPGEQAGPGLRDAGPRPPSRGRRFPVIIVLVAIVGVAGFVLVNALGNATMFFRNADEAVADRGSLGTSRFRLQGTVEGNTIERTDDGVSFVVTYNGVEVAVHHRGDPPELFEPDIPVVLEGRFALPAGSDPEGDAGAEMAAAAPTALLFESDRMLVKHSEEYQADEGDRLRQADEGGQVPPSSAADGGSGQGGS